VDRIEEAEATDLVAEWPADFELSDAWAKVVNEVEEQRSLTSATLLSDARWLPVLRTQFGRHCEVEEALEDGRLRIRVAAPTPLMIAQHLAGWGATLEVEVPRRSELSLLAWAPN
jgi:hypothetical protein